MDRHAREPWSLSLALHRPLSASPPAPLGAEEVQPCPADLRHVAVEVEPALLHRTEARDGVLSWARGRGVTTAQCCHWSRNSFETQMSWDVGT